MSSQANVSAARSMLAGIPDSDAASGPNDVQTVRQQQLEYYWQHYRATNYDGRTIDWDGRQAQGHLETNAISRGEFIPPGFYDAGDQMAPLKFRKPTAPSRLGKTIVKRFTSLLFSQRRHPMVVADDPLTEDWLHGLLEASRMWQTFERARNFGGAMGSVGVGFVFRKGRPIIEVHDPRHCWPEFADQAQLELEAFEKRYQYPLPVRDPESGEVEELWFWYRRVWDRTSDIVWDKVAVTDEEPNWEAERFKRMDHNFGFVPIVWIQNQFVDGDIDGDPDCHGAFETIESIDALNSQANRGTLANCDPTLGVSSDLEFRSLKKGSSNAIQVEKGGSLNYLEISGAGIERAQALADQFKEDVCTQVRCILDRNEGGPSRTVEEVGYNYSAMYDQADTLRERYGEYGVKRLLEMILEAVRKLEQHKVVTDAAGVPTITRQVVKLPKRMDHDERGNIVWVERNIGEGEQIELRWPDYFAPTQDAVGKAVNAAGTAKTLGLIDQKHATEYVAEYFGIENPIKVMENIKEETAIASPFGGGGGDDVASKVADRTLSGAKSPVPNPNASAMKKAGAFQ